MSRITLADIRHAQTKIDPVFLNSPQFECEALSAQLGVSVILKVETLNPIRSFKGRGADWLVQQARGPLVCASAGNFGQAMAYTGRKHGKPITVFAGEKANPLKVARMKEFGAKVILKGEDFDAAKLHAREFAVQNGSRFVEDSKDVETAIGAGTIGLELLTLTELPDALLIPIGNGALINGVGMAIKSHGSKVKIIGVQAAGAPAMIESWQSNTLIEHTTINTIADGIGVRLPVPEALADMKSVLDEAVLVSEEAILKAMKMIFNVAGILVEPSGAVSIAALLENNNLLRGKKVGVILCGSNLTDQQIRDWIL